MPCPRAIRTHPLDRRSEEAAASSGRGTTEGADNDHETIIQVATRANASSVTERKEMPGLVLLVSHHDDVHVEALGNMPFGNPAPMKRDTIFRIASLTKPITAVAAMIRQGCRLLDVILLLDMRLLPDVGLLLDVGRGRLHSGRSVSASSRSPAHDAASGSVLAFSWFDGCGGVEIGFGTLGSVARHAGSAWVSFPASSPESAM
jgi:hypothetical protein